METNANVSKLHQDVCEILQRGYILEVTDLTNRRYSWRKASNWTGGLSKILIGIGVIISFCEGYFRTGYLALIAGVFGTMGMVSKQFSLYALNESKERESALKTTLIEGYRFVRQFLTDPLALQSSASADANANAKADFIVDIEDEDEDHPA